MKKKVDLFIVYQLNDLICKQATGTHEELMKKLCITRSVLFDTIAYLKDEMRAPIIYNKLKKTFEYEYKPKFFLSDDIGLMLAKESEIKDKGRRTDGGDSSIEDDETGNNNSCDMMELTELENVSGGDADDEWYKNSYDVDSDDVILDDDIDFNNLFFDDY